ncbi:ABC transporter ATP-binding protein [Vibrio splendidus]|nr:ABC transporter ATP-binding protein [Vibrio splendidus]MCC4883217.1 ABC transporter ATP-binding protein [Vibrio splendidus]
MIILDKVLVTSEHESWERFSGSRGASEIEFSFEPGMNMVIGRNGAGKSTLLKLLREKMFTKSDAKGVKVKHSKHTEKQLVYFFMAEDNIPSVNLGKVSPYEDDYAQKTVFWLSRKEMSSGMNTLAMIRDAEELAKDASLVFFDEPEQALDARALLDLRKAIKRIAKETQVVVVTHHPSLILMKNAKIIEINPSKPYLPDVEMLVKQI